MDAESQARELQLLLHTQNQDRFKGIESELKEQRKEIKEHGEILIRIDSNTQGIPKRVDILEETKNKANGALWLVTLFVGGWEFFKTFVKP